MLLVSVGVQFRHDAFHVFFSVPAVDAHGAVVDGGVRLPTSQVLGFLGDQSLLAVFLHQQLSEVGSHAIVELGFLAFVRDDDLVPLLGDLVVSFVGVGRVGRVGVGVVARVRLGLGTRVIDWLFRFLLRLLLIGLLGRIVLFLLLVLSFGLGRIVLRFLLLVLLLRSDGRFFLDTNFPTIARVQ